MEVTVTSSSAVGPVFGRLATPVKAPRRARLRRVEQVVDTATDAPLELVRGDARAELPTELADLLRAALHGLGAGEPVTLVVGVADAQAQLSSQQVADLLNVSRPHVVKLAQTNALPHHKIGNRHRFALQDVLTYQRMAQTRTAAALAELAPAGGYRKSDF